MQFIRSSALAELYAASDDGIPPPPGTVARWFLLPQGASAGATLDLAQTWVIPGTYLFLEASLPAGGEAAFAAAAWMFLSSPSFRTPRIAWFPSGVPTGGALSGYVLAVAPSDPSLTGRTLAIVYRNYALIVAPGTALGLDTSLPAFTLTQTSARAITFTTEFGATTLRGAGSIAIPLSGARAGVLQFPLALGLTGGVSDLTHLDVGLRTYYPTPDGGSAGATLVSSLRYPVLDAAQTLTLYADLAPWSAAEGRTFFTFSSGGPAPALESCFSTVTGYQATLTPFLDGSGPSGSPARLVLAVRPGALPPSPDDLYTLVPSGDFALTVPPPKQHAAQVVGGATPALTATLPSTRLMCGLSGIEYVGLASAHNVLSFFTGAAAYVDGFDPTATAQQPTSLTSDATTAYAFPSVAAANAAATPPLTYFAQPEGAVLFQPSSGTFAPLVYLEVAANRLASGVAASAAVPFFPYAGLRADDPEIGTYRVLESKVLSPARRATIAKTGGPPPLAVAETAFVATALAGSDPRFGSATPQGLLALFADQTLQKIDELVLAQMPDASRFSLHGLVNGDALRTALGSNQLFLVVSNTKAIGPHLSPDQKKNAITIEGWTFDLDTSTWTTTNGRDTIVIFKFARGRLVDLAKDTGAWAQAHSQLASPPFNVDDAATSAVIDVILQDAIAAYDDGKGDTDFASFVTAVTDANWQGILILNADTPLTQLPDECKGLAAGIDPALFRAHHVGINIAKIDPTTTPISVANSSMFALIHYRAPQIPVVPNGAAYQFQVDSLKVLFENSAITSFSSTIELLVRQLFGDVVAQPPAESILTLYGTLQRQTIAGKIYDTYLFSTAQNDPRVFPMQAGNVFEKIQVSGAQFVTQLDSGDGLTHTYFALAGLLDFAELEGLDLFSFGAQDPKDVAGLQYSKLLIRMAFDPAVANSATFLFDAGQIAFDAAGSTARADSLYQHFPITLAGLIQPESTSSPGRLGYLGVQSPLTQTALAFPWYGLVFDLDLGSLGALAGKAGFNATLLAAWSPSSSGPYSVFLGLKLPGSDGGKGTISIEGVLNLGFRALVLGRNGPSTYYLLLNALALKFLSLRFPPGGQIDMALFGNPTDEHNSSLGWYAAYTKDQSGGSSGAKDRTARAALRGNTLGALTRSSGGRS